MSRFREKPRLHVPTHPVRVARTVATFPPRIFIPFRPFYLSSRAVARVVPRLRESRNENLLGNACNIREVEARQRSRLRESAGGETR